MRNGKSVLYEDLKRQILIMELDPDEYLDELQLSKSYGLSRTPVREVLQRLAGEGKAMSICGKIKAHVFRQ